MSAKQLLEKYRSNFDLQTIVSALTSPDRLFDILQQTWDGLGDDETKFLAALSRLPQDDYHFTVSGIPGSKESCNLPFAFIESFPLLADGVPIFDINVRNSGLKLHMRELSKQMVAKINLSDLPKCGIIIPGPTSCLEVPNNGMKYRNEDLNKWETVSPFGDNKAGGIFADEQAKLHILNRAEIENAYNTNQGFLLMLPSLYFTSGGEDDLFTKACMAANEQGYIESYNNRVGFLAQNESNGQFTYYITRVCNSLAARTILGHNEGNFDRINIVLHMFALDSLLQTMGNRSRVVMLEEGQTAFPTHYYGLDKKIIFRTPVSFLFAADKGTNCEGSL